MRSVIVADRETTGDGLGEPAEVLPHTLADRFQRLEAGGSCIGMNADAFGGAVIDGDEHGRLALAGDRGRQIGAPDRIHRGGDDGAVMVARSAWCADPRLCEQIVLPHQPQHPAQRGADAIMAEPSPQLAMAFAMKWTGGEHGADCSQ